MAPPKYSSLFALILAGESIFFLPFVLPRIFRPTVLAALEIDNTELGYYFSTYGLVAILAYLVGGPLADRFKPGRLMAVALAMTAMGGFYLSTLPGRLGMTVLYGYWGITTILLFWAALMSATRQYGGEKCQGMAFGWLDGGRGLTAALLGSLAVWLLAITMPTDLGGLTQIERQEAFSGLVQVTSVIVLVIAVLVWVVLGGADQSAHKSTARIDASRIKEVLAMPSVRLQAVMILCAYSAYKLTDDFSLLAQDILSMDEVAAARISTYVFYIRPIAAIGAGYLADKTSASKMMIWSFASILLGGVCMSFGPLSVCAIAVVTLAIASTAIGVFALRGLYFAIMKEGRVPILMTGTAVGLASVIGYLPDVYMGPIMGYFLDHYPGANGHRYLFMASSIFAIVGLLAVFRFRQLYSPLKTAVSH